MATKLANVAISNREKTLRSYCKHKIKAFVLPTWYASTLL